MTFERPELLALPPLLVLLVSLAVTAQWRRTLRLVDAYGGPDAVERLAGRDLSRFPTPRLLCLVAGTVLLSTSAAGPVPAVAPPPESDRPLDLVVAVDISLSMSSEDVGTSRIRRATEVLQGLTDALPLERIGVVVFADWPYTLVPLTDDGHVVRFLTDSLKTDFVPVRDQGTSMGSVVTHARLSLDERRRPRATPLILLLTDGEVHGEEGAVLDSVAAAATDDVVIWTARVGTDAGGPLTVPGADGIPVVDEGGSQVVAGSNEPLLRRIASAGGGAYYDVNDDRGLRRLVDDLGDLGRGSGDAPTPVNFAFWLALLALPCVLWEGAVDSPAHRRLAAAGRGDT